MSDLSRTRRWTAGAALSLVGIGIALSGLFPSWGQTNPFLLVAGASLAVAGVGIARQNLLVHFLSRGIALLTFLLGTIAIVTPLLDRQIASLASLGVFAGSGLALLLTRALLRTPDARRAFAPARFRELFLAGASVTSMTAATMIGIGTFAAIWGETASVAGGLIALGFGHLVSLVGLLRMKTWGLLAGVLNGATALAIGAGVGDDGASFAIALTALPGLLLLLPIALSRLVPETATTSRARVRVEPPRVRIVLPPRGDEPCLDVLHDRAESEARGQARVLGHDGRSHAV